ncbi:hypothetical protein Bca52824_042017 [Brassica carinata]|uniref:Uncharacterized protein n=1 Tax=Brassica carinata TaxID=52824 RepID=A0A8X7RWJ6_BRACI|nr:hypothetical protein Bca52824_042017 [Brassica carinata]
MLNSESLDADAPATLRHGDEKARPRRRRRSLSFPEAEKEYETPPCFGSDPVQEKPTQPEPPKRGSGDLSEEERDEEQQAGWECKDRAKKKTMDKKSVVGEMEARDEGCWKGRSETSDKEDEAPKRAEQVEIESRKSTLGEDGNKIRKNVMDVSETSDKDDETSKRAETESGRARWEKMEGRELARCS